MLIKKYLQIFKLSFEGVLTYRADTFFFFISQTLWFFTDLVIWLAVFSSKKTIGTFDFQGMMMYFALVYFVGFLTNTGIAWRLSEYIVSGELTAFIVRPVSLFWTLFAQDFGEKTYRIIWGLLLMSLIILIFKISMPIGWIVIFAAVLVNSVLLNFLFRFMLGLTAFWFLEIGSFLTIISQLGSFLGGGWIPLSLLPAEVSSWFRLTPFALCLDFPIRVFQKQLAGWELWKGVGFQVAWILIMLVMIIFLSRKGMKSYEAVGR